MKQTTRYHPFLVTLHWALAALIVGALGIGFVGLAATPNSDPHKIGVLRLHMAGGMLILALMIIRFVVRLRTSHPATTNAGRPWSNRLALVTHYGFYVVVLLMVATGYATGILAGLPAIVFGGSGAPLPPSFLTYPTFLAHALLALVLISLIVLHVLAALYHQFVRKDRPFRRMGFGPRSQ